MKISIDGISLDLLKKDDLEALREKLKGMGAPETLSDDEWRMGMKSNRNISHIPQRTNRNVERGSTGFVRVGSVGKADTGDNWKPNTIKKSPLKEYKMGTEEDKLLDKEFQRIPELDTLLKECLEKFPEVKNVEIRATKDEHLMGMKGKIKGKPCIILFVPDKIWGKWGTMVPLIYHELCHFIAKGSKAVDKVFRERADDASKALWKKLQELGQVECQDMEEKGVR